MADDHHPRHPSRLWLALVVLVCILTLVVVAFSHCGSDCESFDLAGCHAKPPAPLGAAAPAPPAPGPDKAPGPDPGPPGPPAPGPSPLPGPLPPSPGPIPAPGPGPAPAPPAPAPAPAPAPSPVPPPKPKCSDVTTFAAVQSVIRTNCVSCHAGRDTYAVAKPIADKMIGRIKLPADNPQHMPAGGLVLSEGDQAVFDKWRADGLLDAGDCDPGTGAPPPPAPPPFQDFRTTEQLMNADLTAVSLADQPNTRYLLATDQVNLGDRAALGQTKDAATKATNSVSTARQLFPVHVVGPGIWRINIEDLNITPSQWKLIEDSSLMQQESFTKVGQLMKATTHSRLPWMMAQEFNDTVLRNGNVYYSLTRAAGTLQDQLAKLGVNFSQDLADFKALLLCFNGSALAPAANRMIGRWDSADGSFWGTFDTGPIKSAAQNCFQNPLLAAAGGKANLTFAAGEQLYTLPNGMIGSFLAAANGQRLLQADPAVVHDFTSNPVAPIIVNALSCFRCHSAGQIHATDAVRASLASGSIGADDTQRALALYKTQDQIDQKFAADNATFSDSMRRLGLDITKRDPISAVSDRYLGDNKLEPIAAFFQLTPADMATCINESSKGKQQIGQLLAGGTASHDQLVQVSQVIQRDCRIFQDPLTTP